MSSGKRILILGGTRYIGRAIATHWVEAGHEVVCLSRNPEKVVNSAGHIPFDRVNSFSQVSSKITCEPWDLILESSAQTLEQAVQAAQVLGKNTEHYVFISTQKVYQSGILLGENSFDSTLCVASSAQVSYEQMKRLTEKSLCSLELPLTIFRTASVFDISDWSRRLHSIVEAFKTGGSLYCGQLEARIGMVSLFEVVAALNVIFEKKTPIGPINIQSHGSTSMQEIQRHLEIECEPHNFSMLAGTGNPQSMISPLSSLTMSCQKALQHGIKLNYIDEWLPALLHRIFQESRASK